MAKNKLPGYRCAPLAMELLEALSSAPDGTVSVSRFARDHGIGAEAVEQLVDLVSTLANRESGVRCVVTLDGDTVTREGRAASIKPTRLSPGEAEVLRYVLDLLGLDDACRARLETALMPSQAEEGSKPTIVSALSVGDYYPQLMAATTDGVRCVLRYRSGRDAAARDRLIDPLRLEATDSAAYLVAWDVKADGERHYRLDRVCGVTLTDDSVEPHGDTPYGIGESLSRDGRLVRVMLPDDVAKNVRWSGIVHRESIEGTAYLTVAVTSREWLFDQLLSLEGARIEEGGELQEEFTAYATSLLIA